METNFNFKSQICTTREQSERLLSLGLKRETADMSYTAIVVNHKVDYRLDCSTPKRIDIPAWSLHRLIEMIPKYFANTKLKFRVEAVKWLMQKEGNVYDNLFILIADCIKNNIFNKEYLEE